MLAHDATHLLDMRRQGLGERTSRDADHHIRHIKTLRQDVHSNQPVDACIRLGEVLEHLLLVLVCVHVTDWHEVVPSLVELGCKVSAVRNRRRKHDRLAWATKHLVRLLDPLVDHITRDLDATLCRLCVRPLTRNLLGSRHVDLFGEKDTQRHEHLRVHKALRSHGIDDIRKHTTQALSEWRGAQSDHLDRWVHVDESLGSLPDLMRLVHNQQVETGEALSLLQRLRRAHLNLLVGTISPVARLQHPMLDPIGIKTGGCLVTQDNTIHDHR